MGFIASLFKGPEKPKPIKPPSTDSRAVQEAAADARRRAALAKGRSSTNVVGLGNIGG